MIDGKYRIIAGPCKRCGCKDAHKVELSDGGAVTMCEKCRKEFEAGKFKVVYETPVVQYNSKALGICKSYGGRYAFEDVI